MRYLGLDPGQSGALVEVASDGRTVVAWRQWRRERTPPRDLLSDLGAETVIAVEAPYVGRGARASLVLAEWTGAVLAQIPEDVTVLRPTAQQWRAKVLRANPDRASAKRLALRAAETVGWVGVPDHVAEAWCLARYAWGWSTSRREP